MSETREESAPTLRFGFVTALDEAGCRVRVQFPDLDGLESFWLHVLRQKTHQDKHYCLPDVGEHVACLLDGAGEEGVVLGAVFGDRDAAQGGGPDVFEIRFGNGDVLRHNRADGSWFIQCAGPVTVPLPPPARRCGADISGAACGCGVRPSPPRAASKSGTSRLNSPVAMATSASKPLSVASSCAAS